LGSLSFENCAVGSKFLGLEVTKTIVHVFNTFDFFSKLPRWYT
jgi:hypothetical protein